MIATYFKRLVLALVAASLASPATADFIVKPGPMAAPVPPDFLGNFVMTEKLQRQLDQVPVGSRVPVELNGDVYEMTYLGKFCEGAICQYGADDVTFIGRGSGGALGSGGGAGSGASSAGRSGTGGGAAGGGASSGGAGHGASGGGGFGAALGAGASAAATSALAQGAMRALVFTPSYEREMNAATERFEKSASELQAASEKLTSTVDGVASVARLAVDGLSRSLKSSIKDLKYSAPEYSPGGGLPSWESAAPEFRVRAEGLWNRLESSPRTTRLADEAHDIGIASLKAAGESHLAGDLEEAESQLKVAETMADLLLGLDPYSGLARDSWEFFTGKNMLTGEELPTWQRAISGAGLAGSLVTFGVASSLSNAIKSSARVLKHLPAARNAKGLVAIQRAQIFIDQAREWGATSAAALKKMTDFSRRVLRNQIKSPEAIARFSARWSEAAQATYPEMIKALRLSAGELAAEAKRLGISPEVLQQRRLTAIGHYNSVTGFTGNVERIKKHFVGVDFRHPVEFKVIPKGTTLRQWKLKDASFGNYFALGTESPSRLGIGSKVTGLDGRIVEKELFEVVTNKDIVVLESVAASVVDEWSVIGRAQPASGGATQIMVDVQELMKK